MATFLPGVTDAPANPKLYSPDYNFLASVMGTKQAQYNRGFDQVKSLQNSLLSQPVSSEENIKFREEMFTKLQTQIKSISGVDLSNPTNVLKAQALFEPLATDEDLIRDIRLTGHLGQQLQRAQAAANSTDPKVRATYSPLVAEDIRYAQEDLRQAKRGDGSIARVQPRDFVPFEDVMADLNERANKQGLKIKRTGHNGAYIMESTNGQQAVPEFEDWARQQMGNRYDRQFDVQGRVLVEREARGLMQTGLSREDALKDIAARKRPELLEKYASKGAHADEKLQSLDTTIEQMRDAYPNGLPASKVAQWQQLLDERRSYADKLKDAQTQTEQLLQDKNLDFLSQNLYGAAADSSKLSAAHGWANTYARSTEETNMRPDEVVLTKWRMAQSDRHHADSMGLQRAGLAQRERFHNDDVLLRKEGLAVQREGIASRIATAKAKGELPSENYMGTSVAANQNRTGVDVVADHERENRAQMFNHAFGAGGSVFEYLMKGDKEHYNGYLTVMGKVHDIAEGHGGKLTGPEMALVENLGKRVGISVINPANAANANALLMNLYVGAQRKLPEQIKLDRSHKVGNSRQAVEAAQQMMARMQGDLAAHSELETQQRKISSTVFTPDGHVRPGYEGVKVLYRTKNGTPVADLAGLPVEKRKQLEATVDERYLSETRLAGSVYNVRKLDDGLIHQAFNKQGITRMTIGGEDVTNDFKNGKLEDGLVSEILRLNTADQKAVYGNEVTTVLDPSTNTVKLTFNISGDNPVASKIKSLKGRLGQPITVEMPYANVQNLPVLAKRLGPLIEENTISNSPLGLGLALTNPRGRAQAPAAWQAQGFDYDVANTTSKNGVRGVNISMKFLNPISKQWEPVKMQNGNFQALTGSRKDLLQLETVLRQNYEHYLNNYVRHERNEGVGEEFVDWETLNTSF